jgi:hypothetical protein
MMAQRLFFYVDFFFGPERRVVHDALELVHAGPRGNITLGSLNASSIDIQLTNV